VNDETFKREASSFDVGGVNRGKAKVTAATHWQEPPLVPSRPGPPTGNYRGAYSGVRPSFPVTKHSNYLSGFVPSPPSQLLFNNARLSTPCSCLTAVFPSHCPSPAHPTSSQELCWQQLGSCGPPLDLAVSCHEKQYGVSQNSRCFGNRALSEAAVLPPRVSARSPVSRWHGWTLPPELLLRERTGTSWHYFCHSLTPSASNWGSVGFETATPPTEHGTGGRVADSNAASQAATYPRHTEK